MPKVVDHDQYRKELLSKCFDLFAEKGYAAITMRQIAQELGVSTGTLYHYFPSKDALFEQLLEENTDRDILQISAELEHVNSLSDRLEAAFTFLEKNQDYFFKQTLIFLDYWQQQQREGKESSDALKRLCERVSQSIAELLNIHDPDVIEFLLSLSDGLILQRMYGQHSINYAKHARLVAAMLTAHLEKSGTVELRP